MHTFRGCGGQEHKRGRRDTRRGLVSKVAAADEPANGASASSHVLNNLIEMFCRNIIYVYLAVWISNTGLSKTMGPKKCHHKFHLADFHLLLLGKG